MVFGIVLVWNFVGAHHIRWRTLCFYEVQMVLLEFELCGLFLRDILSLSLQIDTLLLLVICKLSYVMVIAQCIQHAKHNVLRSVVVLSICILQSFFFQPRPIDSNSWHVGVRREAFTTRLSPLIFVLQSFNQLSLG